jgi:hypothetical protein
MAAVCSMLDVRTKGPEPDDIPPTKLGTQIGG